MYSSLQKLCHTATGSSHIIWDHICYLPLNRGENPTFIPAKAGTRFSDPAGCKAELFWQQCCSFWQQCRMSFTWNFVLLTNSKQIEHVHFVSTLSKGRNFDRHCHQKTATMSKQRSTLSKQHSTLSKESFDCSIRQFCFDVVASVND